MRHLSACVASVVAALIVTTALAAAGVTPAGSGSATPSPSGSLYVTTLPAGAEVYVDGTYVGRSPVLVDALGAGRHGVTMTKAGWSLRETDVTVASGSTAFEDERLASFAPGAATGTIVVRGVAEDAQIWLDGTRQRAKGAPFVALAGTHRLTLVSGSLRTARDVTVFPDTTTDVLARDPAPAAASRQTASVVASLEEWLPDATLAMIGKKYAIRYRGHSIDGRIGDRSMRIDGENVSYSGPPEMIGGKLYLPLGMLERLSGSVVHAEPK